MTATATSPDHSTCRHCDQPITWDEVCYTHDDTGFAECGVTITGGTEVAPGVTVNPRVRAPSGKHRDKRAEPVEWS